MLKKLMERAKELREMKLAVEVRLKELELQQVRDNKKIRESTTEEDDLKQVQKWLNGETNKLVTLSGGSFTNAVTWTS